MHPTALVTEDDHVERGSFGDSSSGPAPFSGQYSRWKFSEALSGGRTQYTGVQACPSGLVCAYATCPIIGEAERLCKGAPPGQGSPTTHPASQAR